MTKDSRIIELDGLRGVAVLCVLIHHYVTGVLAGPFTLYFVEIRQILAPFFLSGVDLFFVLSGFIVGGIVIDGYRKPGFARAFYIRRATRILPLYFGIYALFLIAVAINDRSPNAMGLWLLKDNMPLWSYAIFAQNYFMAFEGHAGGKFFAMAWSVATEEHFYIFFPMLLWFAGFQRALFGCVALLFICPIIRHVAFDNLGYFAAYAPFPSRADSIAWGVVLSAGLRLFPEIKKNRSARWAFAAALTATAILLVANSRMAFLGTNLFSVLAIFYACCIFFAVTDTPMLGRVLRSRLLVLFGTISYALYMFHQLVNGALHGFVLNQAPKIETWTDVGVTAASVLIATGAAYISTRFLETPIRGFGYRLTQDADSHLKLRQLEVGRQA